ncbi:hypothetical protein IV203_027977 [Nitzschia inconspicua]|uniref:Uncharacterized protein n=1 Tax=Nitzschia inconspicua TaxID=303405 RepID=A0A9K3M0W8_9STRA|nr:hypothetical protein IV203_027977 [Nitzschia inconspicua]
MLWEGRQETLLGISLLSIYVGMFPSILLVHSFHDASEPSQFLARAVLTCSLVNVIGRTLVSKERIRRVGVTFFLIAVGFDVFSSMLYAWTIYTQVVRKYDTFQSTNSDDPSLDILTQAIPKVRLFVFAISVSIWFWNWLHRIRMIAFFRNPKILTSILSSAHHTMWGAPGFYGRNHFFAYYELGNHMMMGFMSLQWLTWKGQRSMSTTPSNQSELGWEVLATITALLILGSLTASDKVDGKKNELKPKKNETEDSCILFWLSIDSGKLLCNCPSCNSKTAFSLYPTWCHHWFTTLDDVMVQMERFKQDHYIESKIHQPNDSERAKEKDDKAVVNPVTANLKVANNYQSDTGWRCACEGGFLPPGMLKSFGGAEAIMRLGTGQCYHKQI